VAAITGTSLPKHKIDGVNILDMMKGNFEAKPRREFLYYYHNNHLEAVRKDNWKLVLPHDHRSYEGVLPGNDGHPGPYTPGHTELAMYILRRDPGEEYDVKELQQISETARQDLGDALTEREGENRRECGRVE
jgi:arylsulfatase A-like enzyme